MEEALWKLISIAEQAAPELWRIGLRQVQIGVTMRYIGFGLLVAFSIVLWVIAGVIRRADVRTRKELLGKGWHSHGNADDGWIFFVAFGIVILMLAGVALGEALTRSYNPEYYAIGVLLDLMQVQ